MDYIVRATAADGQIRAFAATTRETVETARADHNTSPVATAALGRLLTAGAMMGVMMKGDKDLLTLRIHAGGPLNGITVTADSKGNVKGYVGNPDVVIPANKKGKLDVVEGTLYPLLTRLKNGEFLAYRWEESTGGPPRKYYQITEKGKLFLAELLNTWKELTDSVNQITKNNNSTDAPESSFHPNS